MGQEAQTQIMLRVFFILLPPDISNRFLAQWGTYKGSTSSATIQLPTAYYSKNSYSWVGNHYYKSKDTGGGGATPLIHQVQADYSGLSNTQVLISVNISNGYLGCNWITIGYSS